MFPCTFLASVGKYLVPTYIYIYSSFGFLASDIAIMNAHMFTAFFQAVEPPNEEVISSAVNLLYKVEYYILFVYV
jgi:hypothetical protein